MTEEELVSLSLDSLPWAPRGKCCCKQKLSWAHSSDEFQCILFCCVPKPNSGSTCGSWWWLLSLSGQLSVACVWCCPVAFSRWESAQLSLSVAVTAYYRLYGVAYVNGTSVKIPCHCLSSEVHCCVSFIAEVWLLSCKWLCCIYWGSCFTGDFPCKLVLSGQFSLSSTMLSNWSCMY